MTTKPKDKMIRWLCTSCNNEFESKDEDLDSETSSHMIDHKDDYIELVGNDQRKRHKPKRP